MKKQLTVRVDESLADKLREHARGESERHHYKISMSDIIRSLIEKFFNINRDE